MPGFELFGDLERSQVQDVLDTGDLMRYGFDGKRQGRWKATELERALAARMQVRHAQLVNSGTAALTVAMACAGIGAGDEVILPTFTFVASFEAVLSLGAIPVLADIDDTLTLDPNSVKKQLSSRTKAVMPVHMCGSMADLRALKEICDSHDLFLIEDACQAIGGSFDGKPLGSYGHLGCFSFDYVKTITCGEGGAVITNDTSLHYRADHYSDHGHDHTGTDRGAEDHPFMGYNYRISELHAAVGLAQIGRLDEFIRMQQANYHVLKQALQGIEEIEFRRIPASGVENYSFLTCFLPTETLARSAQKELQEAGIDGCFYWYDNLWHYHRKWDHLKQGTTLGSLPKATQASLETMKSRDFRASDHWMGRTVSCLIKLGWTEAEVAGRAKTMASVLKKIR